MIFTISADVARVTFSSFINNVVLSIWFGCIFVQPFLSTYLKTSLFHLSVRSPGNFDASRNNISGVSKVFHLWLVATLWHLTKKLCNLLNPLASPNFICGQSFTSFLYNVNILFGFPYIFSNKYSACLNSSSGGRFQTCYLFGLDQNRPEQI